MKIRRVIAVSLAVVSMISMLSACGKNTENAEATADTKSKSDAMGRYLEEEVVLPEEGRIMDIKVLDDKTIGVVLTNDEDNMTLWTTKDVGVTWEKEYDVVLDMAKQEHMSRTTDRKSTRLNSSH